MGVNKVPVPPGYRGAEYVEFVYQKKVEANWTCSMCGYQAPQGSHSDIIAHHWDKDSLFEVDIICESCHSKVTGGRH